MKKNWLNSLCIEHREAKVIAEQARYGWLFNTKKCAKLVRLLALRMERIDAKLRPSLPVTVKQWGVQVMKPFNMDGSVNFHVAKWGLEVDGPFTRVVFEEMNLGSDPQLKAFLLSLGWKPTLWNYRKKDSKNGKRGERTGPKLHEGGELCKNLSKLDGVLGRRIVFYLQCKHRRSLLEGLLLLVRDDGRISGEANTIGAATHRMTHKKIVNIPGCDAYYGGHIRSLFIAPKGYSIVGCDSKGCQARMLCHYMGDDKYTAMVLNDDIHSVNQRLVGLRSRSEAKTVYYAFLFGAGDAKVGSSLGGSAKAGRAAKTKFIKAIPMIGTLIKRVKKRVDTVGYVYGLDGRKVYVSSSHKALNYLLQSAEAIYMKYAQCILWKAIRGEQLDANFVATIHDEFQMEVRDDHVARVRELALESMLKAGTHLGINLPMEGDVKVGKTWKKTH